MDRAVCGYCRSGYFRCGVYRPDWDRLLATFQNIPTPQKMVVDSGIVKVDEVKFRVDVFVPSFDDLKKRIKSGS